MEPFSAIGLAGNVVTFIDFAGKLITGSLELYHSAHGSAAANQTLEDVVKDLEHICLRLSPPESIEGNIMGSDPPDFGSTLIPILFACRSLGQRLLAKLESLKVKSKHRAWKSFQQTLKCAWKENEIRTYKEQLDLYRSQITAHLLTVLW